jgi:glycosyltransferase involved in cell wall biosynthesis
MSARVNETGRGPSKVLIISFQYWPALNARAFRWTALAEDWVRKGREVHVVCARVPDRPVLETQNGVRIHRVGSAWIERLRGAAIPVTGGETAARRSAIRYAATATARAIWHRIYWPDTSCTWYFAARSKARELLAAIRPEAVVSVSPPFTAVAVGRSLARRSRRESRWLIDLGDPFSFADEAPPNNFHIYRGLNIRFERSCFAAADSVSVTTPETRDRYAALFPESAQKIIVIPPLVALPETGGGTVHAGRSDRRQLAFLGRLYPTIRPPDFLLALFAALAEAPAGERYELHFYGETWECEASFAPYRHMLGRNLFVHGAVPRERAASAMRSAYALVNIGNDTRYQLPSKIVEYAMTGRPILNLVAHPDDSSARFLARHPARLTLTARGRGPTPEDLKRLREFLGRTPEEISPAMLHTWLAPYTLPQISARYDALLSGASPPGEPHNR